MKKILVWVLLVSLINLTGCFYTEQLSPSSFDFGERKKLTVITQDTSYNFKGDDYRLEKDTLIGATGFTEISSTTRRTEYVHIPVNEMQAVEVEKVDVLNTTLLSAGIAVIAVLVIGFIALGNVKWGLGSD